MTYKIKSIRPNRLALATFGSRTLGTASRGYRARAEAGGEELLFEVVHLAETSLIGVAYEQLRCFRRVEGGIPIADQIRAAVEGALAWWNDSAG